MVQLYSAFIALCCFPQLTTGLSNEYSLQTGRPKGTKSKDNPFAAMYANKILKFTTDEISYQWHKVRLLLYRRVRVCGYPRRLPAANGIPTQALQRRSSSRVAYLMTQTYQQRCQSLTAVMQGLEHFRVSWRGNAALRQRWSGTAGDQHAAYECAGRAA